MMIRCRLELRPGMSSISVTASMTTRPRPVAYISRTPATPRILPEVGKSGAGTISINWSTLHVGWSMT